ncbi:hypothetical protein BJ508DRAFT_350892 [Ascobolus immersus RN42]|uniref:Uncharacterized protein n=1 Tax=Ascobolus immersus RN42 TaxID=1160509 RepID=A0A3N4HT27_ASCIM|nr:hypothetical protein BJ508DRAFT_350892 [Ascobolus immersus RN42]
MGHLAKQKMAEKRGPTYDLPPPLPKLAQCRKAPKKESSKAPSTPKVFPPKPEPSGSKRSTSSQVKQWEGLTLPTIYSAFTTSYLPMLRTRLILDYTSFLPPQSPLLPHHSSGISNKVDWTKVAYAIEDEKKQQEQARVSQMFMPPRKARQLSRQSIPLVWHALLLASRGPEECGGLEAEYIETEIRKFVVRMAGREDWSLKWVAGQGDWDGLAVQVVGDVRLIEFVFEGEERRDIGEAARKFRGVYFESCRRMLRGSEVRPQVFWELTEVGERLEAGKWRRIDRSKTPVVGADACFGLWKEMAPRWNWWGKDKVALE